MNKSTQHSKSIKALLVLIILGIIGATLWYVLNNTSNRQENTNFDGTSPQVSQSETYKRSTSVPSDWSTYINEEYRFEISHPTNWGLGEENRELSNDTSLNEKNFLYLGFRPGQNGPMAVQYTLEVKHEALDQAVVYRKNSINNFQREIEALYEGTNDQYVLTNEDYFTYDGYDAVRLESYSMTASDEMYTTEFYISANALLYKFSSSLHSGNAFQDKEVLTVFESLEIK